VNTSQHNVPTTAMSEMINMGVLRANGFGRASTTSTTHEEHSTKRHRPERGCVPARACRCGRETSSFVGIVEADDPGGVAVELGLDHDPYPASVRNRTTVTISVIARL
jgi:hypothetical protein